MMKRFGSQFPDDDCSVTQGLTPRRRPACSDMGINRVESVRGREGTYSSAEEVAVVVGIMELQCRH